MLKWSSTPTLMPMRYLPCFVRFVDGPTLAQNPPCQPNEAVALPCAGGMVQPSPPSPAPSRPNAEPQGYNMAKVAFLGLGVMGFPMAGHLVKKGGHEVTVYNRTAAKARQWAEKFGGKTAT